MDQTSQGAGAPFAPPHCRLALPLSVWCARCAHSVSSCSLAARLARTLVLVERLMPVLLSATDAAAVEAAAAAAGVAGLMLVPIMLLMHTLLLGSRRPVRTHGQLSQWKELHGPKKSGATDAAASDAKQQGGANSSTSGIAAGGDGGGAAAGRPPKTDSGANDARRSRTNSTASAGSVDASQLSSLLLR